LRQVRKAFPCISRAHRMEAADRGPTQLQEVIQAVRHWLVEWAQEQHDLLKQQAQLTQHGSPMPMGTLAASSGWEPSEQDANSCTIEAEAHWSPNVHPTKEADTGLEAQSCELTLSRSRLRWDSYEQEMAAQRQLVLRMLTTFDNPHPRRSLPWQVLRRFTNAFCGILPAEPPDNTLVQVVTSTAFNGLVVLLIVLNTIFMGVEADMGVRVALEGPSRKLPAFITIVNRAFAVGFLVELVTRMAALRLWFLAGPDRAWNAFDVFLVTISIVQLALEGSGVGFMRMARMLRIIRVARIFRVAKVFGELRELVSAMMNAVAALAWSLILLLMIMYTFAIIFLLGAQNCIQDGGCSGIEVVEWYPSLSRTMYTLFLAISGGDWGMMAAELIQYSGLYTVMWVLYVIMTMFCMLNLLTGVFVSVSSEVQSRSSQIRQKINAEENFVRDMKDLFTALDTNNTGMLTPEEFSDCLQNDYVVAFLEGAGLTITDFRTLFELLDYNHSGDVSIVDFIAGCARLRGPAKSMYLQKLLLQVAGLERSLEQLQRQLDSTARAAPQLRQQPQPPPVQVAQRPVPGPQQHEGPPAPARVGSWHGTWAEAASGPAASAASAWSQALSRI